MNYKILVVDDEPANVRALERLFRDHYDVFTAGSGGDALFMIEHHDMALLIADQRMPGMSGIELMRRTAQLRPHMVRILLTGYTDVESLIQAINSGQVYKYITKPWNNEDLLLTVTRALEHYQTVKSRHNLQMVNERLLSRLREIAELAGGEDGEVAGEQPSHSGAGPQPQLDVDSNLSAGVA